MSIKRILVIFVSALFIVSINSPAFSQVPSLINYQGRLTNADGASVSNGSYFLTFALYLTDSGGSPEWAETQEVFINNGLYHVLLGSVTPLAYALFDDSLYLGVTVSPDQEMVPRQLLVSSPYAIRAEVANTIAEGAINNVHIMDNVITGEKINNGSLMAEDLMDETVINEILDDDGTDSGLDADFLDGRSSSDFTLVGEDYGRAGVAIDLYESGQTLSNRYVNTVGPEIVSGNDSAAILQALNSGSGAGLRGSSQDHHGTIGYTDSADSGGVYGNSPSGYGVWGNSENNHAVFGQSTNGRGVKGVSPEGGVYGESTQGVGVEGKSNTNDGVVGVTLTSNKSGVFGNSEVGNGVTGRSAGASGVLGVTTSSEPGDAGVTARNEGGGIAIRSEGDLFVAEGAYRGDLGPGGGAPFPRPAWDSGWVPIAPDENIVLPHTVGGSLDDYVVDFQQKDVIQEYPSLPLIGIHNYGIGTRSGGVSHSGAYFHDLKTYEVSIERYEDDRYTDHVRIRIWLVQ